MKVCWSGLLLLAVYIFTAQAESKAYSEILSEPRIHRLPFRTSKCFYPDTDPPMLLDVNEARTVPNMCSHLVCNADYTLNVHMCGKNNVPDGCREAPEDLRLPYPYCCPKIVC